MTLTSKNGPDSKTCIVPKPIFELLGKPSGLVFIKKGKHILVKAGSKENQVDKKLQRRST